MIMNNEGAMGMSSDAAKRELTIPVSLNTIRKNLEILKERIAALQNRLIPISRAIIPSEKVTKNKEAASVQLTSELMGISDQVRSASNVIGDIIDSLEI
jgi:hypothetical protein